MRSVTTLVIKVIFIFIITCSMGADKVQALTFTVNSTDDAEDSIPGNGSCDDGQGRCTLRAAIMEANAWPGADLIILPSNTYLLSITGRGEEAAVSGDLDITESLTITGGGQETTLIDGGGIDRVFHIHPLSISVTITDLTIQNGADELDFGSGKGGGIYNNQVDLTLTNVTLKENSGNNTQGASGRGGGIYNDSGGLILLNVNLVDNKTSIGGIGLGGGIYNDGVLDFNTGIVIGNLSQGGGGLYNNGNVTIEKVSFENNSAGSGVGGGIYNSGALTLKKSIITGRTDGSSSADLGGGILNNGTPVNIENVTISGNKVNRDGGGIYNGYQVPDSLITLTNVTISHNTALLNAGGIYNKTNIPVNVVTIKNTVIANSTGGNCSGAITSNGHNLEDENSCGLSGTGDLINTNPNLGPLEDNEGPTLTHALILPSPAINAGDNNGCPATDQRGVRRPLGPTCDIGAYEYNPFIHSLFLPLVIRN